MKKGFQNQPNQRFDFGEHFISTGQGVHLQLVISINVHFTSVLLLLFILLKYCLSLDLHCYKF